MLWKNSPHDAPSLQTHVNFKRGSNMVSFGKHCNALIIMYQVIIEAKIYLRKELTCAQKVLWPVRLQWFPVAINVCTNSTMKVGSRPKIMLGFEVRALYFDEIKKRRTLINANHKYPWHVLETEACRRPVRSEAGRRIKDNLNAAAYSK